MLTSEEERIRSTSPSLNSPLRTTTHAVPEMRPSPSSTLTHQISTPQISISKPKVGPLLVLVLHKSAPDDHRSAKTSQKLSHSHCPSSMHLLLVSRHSCQLLQSPQDSALIPSWMLTLRQALPTYTSSELRSAKTLSSMANANTATSAPTHTAEPG